MKPMTKVGDVDHLTESERERLAAVSERFAFRANPYYLNLIDWNDPEDPIRRIIIPHESELNEYGTWDPSAEATNYVVPGCQHKYKQTALLLVSNVCEAYCRFCFRKRLFQDNATETSLDVAPGVAYIAAHPEITNVLLTGGDPLILSTGRLAAVLAALGEIPHVAVVRIGSKSLAFNPMRVSNDPALLDLFTRFNQTGKRIYVMAHFDHPRELTAEARMAIALLQEAGCTILHQCPLLAGVNDKPEVLAELWEQLANAGVTPYYIFQNRPVMGNGGFVVPLERGYALIEAARARVSGLAKRARYVMSHATGKVEVLAVDHGQIYLKYHQAKHAEDQGRFLVSRLTADASWLDDLPDIPQHHGAAAE